MDVTLNINFRGADRDVEVSVVTFYFIVAAALLGSLQ